MKELLLNEYPAHFGATGRYTISALENEGTFSLNDEKACRECRGQNRQQCLEEDADIHHIFPYAYCTNVGIPPKKFNSVINKSPIYATSNRSIGGHAPSIYIGTMARKGLEHDKIVEAIESHMVNFDYLSTDNFDEYFIDRAKKLLSAIESVTGKTIEGKDSEETIREFGRSLNIQPATNAAVLPNVDQDISSTKNND